MQQLITIAVNGTTGILKAIKTCALEVKRVILTSSYAAIVDYSKPLTYIYTEADWNPITEDEALKSAPFAYLASKTFAEKAAWRFVDEEKPGFSLTTINPPIVFGPVIYALSSVDSINTSNARFVSLLRGGPSTPCPLTINYLFVDVRDLAMAHVRALERPKAENRRFLVTAGNYSNAEIARIIGEEHPEFKDRMPVGEAIKSGERPVSSVNGYNNRDSIVVLGISYRTLKESVVSAVDSIKELL